MTKIIVSGKTVDDAIANGLQELSVTRDKVKVTVLEEASKGLFGLIGSKDAKVELELLEDPTSEPEKEPEDNRLDQVLSFMRDMFQAMNQHVEIEPVQKDDHLRLNLHGEELGILIGRRGQTLDAMQYLVNIVANRRSDEHMRIILDAENFRERRKQTLEQLAERLAEKVVRSKREVILEPMTPLERKIIHSRLQDHPKVKTYSKGDEPNRKVVIALKS